jgi:hypothetical protein
VRLRVAAPCRARGPGGPLLLLLRLLLLLLLLLLKLSRGEAARRRVGARPVVASLFLAAAAGRANPPPFPAASDLEPRLGWCTAVKEGDAAESLLLLVAVGAAAGALSRRLKNCARWVSADVSLSFPVRRFNSATYRCRSNMKKAERVEVESHSAEALKCNAHFFQLFFSWGAANPPPLLLLIAST